MMAILWFLWVNLLLWGFILSGWLAFALVLNVILWTGRGIRHVWTTGRFHP